MDDEESEDDEDFVDDGSGGSGSDDEEGEAEQDEDDESMVDESVDKDELKALKKNEQTTGKRKKPNQKWKVLKMDMKLLTW